MQLMNEPHIFKGLQRDLSISKYDPSFLYDAHNIRLTAREDDTLLSITNERGTEDTNISFEGIYIGHCLIDKSLVIFSKGIVDYIYLISLEKPIEKKILFIGDLNFRVEDKVSTIACYENNLVQKVYWIDGRNQPRVINIKDEAFKDGYITNPTKFNFVQELTLNETISVERIFTSAGIFTPGVIQYAFTYYNKYGQESNIFHTTPLQYVSYNNRGGSPEDKIGCAFKLTVNNLDTNFDYLRIYSIFRSSINATPVVKRVSDINIKNLIANTPIKSKTIEISKLIDIDSSLGQRFWGIDNFNTITYNNYSGNPVYVVPDIQGYNDCSVTDVDNNIVVLDRTKKLVIKNGRAVINETKCPRIAEAVGITGNIPDGEYKVLSFKEDVLNLGNSLLGYGIFRVGNSHYINYNWDIVNNSVVIWSDAGAPGQLVPITVPIPTKESSTDLFLIISSEPRMDDRHFIRSVYYDSSNCYIADLKETEYQYGASSAQPRGTAPASSYDTINTTSTVYIDYGTQGDDVDPTQLLYIGGEEIIAKSFTQKDNTLFFGNYEIKRYHPNVTPTVNSSTTELAKIVGDSQNGSASYALISYKDSESAGFKYGDYYRCGIQFQHKSGKWSDPVFLTDYQIQKRFKEEGTTVKKPIIETTVAFSDEDMEKLNSGNYVKIRPVVVYPEISDRTTICQAVACPTVYTDDNRNNKGLHSQSSWFFRPYNNDGGLSITNSPWSKHNKSLPYYGNIELDNSSEYTDDFNTWLNNYYLELKKDNNGDYKLDTHEETTYFGEDYYTYTVFEEKSNWISRIGIDVLGDRYKAVTGKDYHKTGDQKSSPVATLRRVEIQGNFDTDKKFKVDWETCTFHSPEIDSDDSLYSFPLNDIKARIVGYVNFANTVGKIATTTKTPVISSSAGGEINYESRAYQGAGIISGLFYEDYLVSYASNSFVPFSKEKLPYKWLVSPWQMSGSITNDFLRPTDKGTMTSELKTKKLSNLRFANTVFASSGEYLDILLESKLNVPQLFSSDQLSIVKIGNDVYEGNVDTGLIPNNSSVFFAKNGNYNDDTITPIDSNSWYGSKVIEEGTETKISTINYYKWNKGSWIKVDDLAQSSYPSLGVKKSIIRMKYKSTPHIVAKTDNTTADTPILYQYVKDTVGNTSDLSILPIVEFYRDIDINAIFGGKQQDALTNALWMPAGITYNVSDITNNTITIQYTYGDTWFGRYDILKTYAFTPEDENQIVEIGSFQLESRINPECRYDRNRGLIDNTNVNNTNFNLQNPVYNQQNNFFTYRILDSDFYKINTFSNQITWTKEKSLGEQVDTWTNITLASTHDLDGNYGPIISMNTWKDNIYCFQEKAISNIMFNSRVQIPASDGVPIEITNSYKVDGHRYVSDGIGCNNKQAIQETPAGIYFIDCISNNLYHIGGDMTDISTTHSMTTWFKKNNVKKLLYDGLNHDLYAVTDGDSLCYSEILGQFTSFMSYDNIDLIENVNKLVFTVRDSHLYEMFKGEYNMFFGKYKPWDITLVSNGRDQSLTGIDKTYSTIEYRMDLKTTDYLHKNSFDYIQATNEYQDTGVVPLTSSYLKKKFRIWHIDFPRNTKLDDYGRGAKDRIRNTWCRVKLGMWKETDPGFKEAKKTAKAELHDIITQYLV